MCVVGAQACVCKCVCARVRVCAARACMFFTLSFCGFVLL